MRRRQNNSTPFSLFAFQDIITSTTGILILVVILITLSLVNSFSHTPQQQTEDLTEQLEAMLVETQGQIKSKEEALQANRKELQQVTIYTRDQFEKQKMETERQKEKFETELKQVTSRLERTKQDDRQWDTRLENQRANYEQQRRELEELQAQLTQKNHELDDAERQLTSNKSRLANTKPKETIRYNPSSDAGKAAWLVQIDPTQILVARAGITERPQVFAANGVAFIDWAKGIARTDNYFFLLLRPGNIPAFDRIKEQLRESGYDLGVELLDADQMAVDPVKGGGV